MKVNLLTRWCWRGASVAPTQDGHRPGVDDPGSRDENHSGSNGHVDSMTVINSDGSTTSSRGHFRTIITTVGMITVICVVGYFCRDYIRKVLLWMDAQEVWVVVLVFLALFTIVSFPFTWGYIIINIAAGYMFGTWQGLGLTVCTVTLAVMLVHVLIRGCLREFIHRQVLKSRIVSALLTVLAGAHAFKVIAVTRLTPIPFGLQNAVFAVSGVPTLLYMTATVLGLLPTQILNCYLGTTVRNLQDVVSENSSATATGWIIFSIQIAISIGLTVWVVRRAKAELHKTMTAELTHPSNSNSPNTPSPPLTSTGNTQFPVSAQSTNGIANIATLVDTSPIHPVGNPNSPGHGQDHCTPVSLQNQQQKQDNPNPLNAPVAHPRLPIALQTPITPTRPSQTLRQVSSSHLSYLASSDPFYDTLDHLSPSQNISRKYAPIYDADNLQCNIEICQGPRVNNNEKY